MSDVRSQRLVATQVTATSAWVTLFEVPPANVILWKSYGMQNLATAPSTINLVLLAAGVAIWFEVWTAQPNESVFRELWVAMNPGDLVQVNVSAQPVAFMAFGAVLAGGPPYETLPITQDPLDLPVILEAGLRGASPSIRGA